MLNRIAATCVVAFAAFAATTAHADVTCSLLIDAANGKEVLREGDCDKAVTPASTFKVPLAVMGFDSGILADADHPAWDFQPGFADWMENWKTTVTPRYWLDKSVVWYSQELTKKLGMEKFRGYVAAFDYGNKDVSGNPGKDDGLTQAWLRSSLKITPTQEAAFLTKLVNRTLPVTPKAFDMTYAAMPQVKLDNGWTVSGKTGTSFLSNADGSADAEKRQLGWYVGWAEKDGRKIVFVRLVEDQKKQKTFAGMRARQGTLDWLPAQLEKL